MSCSFCKNPNHTINRCSSQEILRLWFEMYNTFLHLRNDPRCINDYMLSRIMAPIINAHYTVPQLKVVCHRKIVSFNSNGGLKSDYIHRIIQECFEEYELTHPYEWTIDRTPDYTLFHIQPTNLTAHFEAHAGSKKFNIISTLEVDSIDSEDATFECGICYDNVSTSVGVSYNCGHQFCAPCVKQVLRHMPNTRERPNCAFCREPISHLNAKNIKTYKKIVEFCA
jgi:hypothetical protein